MITYGNFNLVSSCKNNKWSIISTIIITAISNHSLFTLKVT